MFRVLTVRYSYSTTYLYVVYQLAPFAIIGIMTKPIAAPFAQNERIHTASSCNDLFVHIQIYMSRNKIVKLCMCMMAIFPSTIKTVSSDIYWNMWPVAAGGASGRIDIGRGAVLLPNNFENVRENFPCPAGCGATLFVLASEALPD